MFFKKDSETSSRMTGRARLTIGLRYANIVLELKKYMVEQIKPGKIVPGLSLPEGAIVNPTPGTGEESLRDRFESLQRLANLASLSGVKGINVGPVIEKTPKVTK